MTTSIKYNSSGVQQWVQIYNASAENDQANSIAVDGLGNVYVTGYSVGIGTNNDYATIKYNSSGVQQWVQRYNGPLNIDDQANSIAVDNSGNVYVTGYSYGSGTDVDYATIKYSQQTPYLLLKTLIEGFYNNTTNKMVRDTVKVYLRNASSPYLIIDSAKSVLDSNGNGIFNYSSAAIGTPYYIVVNHRNSIETWSKHAIIIFAYPFSYDFTTAAIKAYGDNLVLKGSKYCIYSGDVNQSGFIDLTDIILVYNDANNSVGGYVPTDLNGDYFVDLSDLIIAYNNSNNFVGVIMP